MYQSDFLVEIIVENSISAVKIGICICIWFGLAVCVRALHKDSFHLVK